MSSGHWAKTVIIADSDVVTFPVTVVLNEKHQRKSRHNLHFGAKAPGLITAGEFRVRGRPLPSVGGWSVLTPEMLSIDLSSNEFEDGLKLQFFGALAALHIEELTPLTGTRISLAIESNNHLAREQARVDFP